MPEQSDAIGSVFLSYASQDAEAAARICEALQAAGVKVWLDKSELRGGDAWDAQIKKRIHDCALFIPVISAHTNARSEGYFRGEWSLATRRLLNIAQDSAFLVPVVVDGTREADARVPDEFLLAQWTWLPNGETPPAFAHRVRQLLEGKPAAVRHARPEEENRANSCASHRDWETRQASCAGCRTRPGGIAAGPGCWGRLVLPACSRQPCCNASPKCRFDCAGCAHRARNRSRYCRSPT